MFDNFIRKCGEKDRPQVGAKCHLLAVRRLASLNPRPRLWDTPSPGQNQKGPQAHRWVGAPSPQGSSPSLPPPPPAQHTAPQSFCPVEKGPAFPDRQTRVPLISEQAMGRQTGKSESATAACIPPGAEVGTPGKNAGSLLSVELGTAPRTSSSATKARPSSPAPWGLQTREEHGTQRPGLWASWEGKDSTGGAAGEGGTRE